MATLSGILSSIEISKWISKRNIPNVNGSVISQFTEWINGFWRVYIHIYRHLRTSNFDSYITKTSVRERICLLIKYIRAICSVPRSVAVVRIEGTFGESSDSLWKLEKSPLSSWLIVEFNPALSSSSTWKQPLNSKHGGVCTIWHRISILLVDCVYARALELGGSSFSRTSRYLLSSDSATPWNRSRAARAVVRTRSDERRKQRREKQGRPVENSKSSLTRLPSMEN